ncbi:conserved hypothetical protein [uncultured Paludibacter sp.]|uniref:Alpha/beta hydrolase n=1 Tax=uncultured Paludibacter sp. TaxID=497635 RepID=A0A653A6K4_9BACT|nr:conserved hypothetical protein [uncultured Paludibacter sp.]
MNLNYSQRFTKLNSVFQLGVSTHLEDSDVDIRFFTFKSSLMSVNNTVISETDEEINENLSFSYPVFIPAKKRRSDKAILLLHGLNERSWNKYLTWAEYLCVATGKPVILFPIAFHINRSPKSWSNPRALQNILHLRRQRNSNDRSISYANVILSERLSENPFLFYTSGRQSLFDLIQLFEEIKAGKHPFFKENTQLDIFSYSIGAFLAQITLMTDLNHLFSDSKLFMFCGGSIFSKMYGVSRSIMDKNAYENLHRYFIFSFDTDTNLNWNRDKIFDSFYSMISPERDLEKRTSFFHQKSDRIKGILLKQDVVIPYIGVQEALGKDITEANTKLMDFSFSYTHENPFPVGKNIDSQAVNDAFLRVFSQAAAFLA